eukprot:7524237-Pyramimonas_sp.AAC.1
MEGEVGRRWERLANGLMPCACKTVARPVRSGAQSHQTQAVQLRSREGAWRDCANGPSPTPPSPPPLSSPPPPPLTSTLLASCAPRLLSPPSPRKHLS